MIIDNISSDVAKELFTVLSYCDDVLVAKIPDFIFEKICSKAADSTIDCYMDKNKKLMDQPISEECKDLLCLLYYEYIADFETKKEIQNILQQNDITSLAS